MTYLQPLLLLCCSLIAAGLARARSPLGRRVAWSGLLALFLVCWPPADWLFSRPLEGRYRAEPPRWPGAIDAVVVLGSAIEPAQYERPYALPDYDTVKRTEHAAWLWRKWGPLPVLACEGFRPRQDRGMADLLRRAGVSSQWIWVENQSRSTHENAVLGAAVLREHGVRRIALVVDAQSMPRAAACFRKLGFEVFPMPSEIRTLGGWRDELLPNWRAVQRNEVTLHELAGTAWYWLRGWI